MIERNLIDEFIGRSENRANDGASNRGDSQESDRCQSTNASMYWTNDYKDGGYMRNYGPPAQRTEHDGISKFLMSQLNMNAAANELHGQGNRYSNGIVPPTVASPASFNNTFVPTNRMQFGRTSIHNNMMQPVMYPESTPNMNGCDNHNYHGQADFSQTSRSTGSIYGVLPDTAGPPLMTSQMHPVTLPSSNPMVHQGTNNPLFFMNPIQNDLNYFSNDASSHPPSLAERFIGQFLNNNVSNVNNPAEGNVPGSPTQRVARSGSFTHASLPVLNIGAYPTIPTYGETDARFSKKLTDRISRVSLSAMNNAATKRHGQVAPNHTAMDMASTTKPVVFPSLSAASTAVCATLSDATTCLHRSGSDYALSRETSMLYLPNAIKGGNEDSQDQLPFNTTVSHSLQSVDPRLGHQGGYPNSMMPGEFNDMMPMTDDRYFMFENRDYALGAINDDNSALYNPNAFLMPGIENSVDGSQPSLFPLFDGNANPPLPTNPRGHSGDICSRIPMPIHSLWENPQVPSTEDIDWNLPYMKDIDDDGHDVSPKIRRLMLQNMLSHDKILSPFELSIFRTTYCFGGCENARTPSKCWASHSSSSEHDQRWCRRNPYLYQYKHLLCPEIQSLKDRLKEEAKKNDVSQQQKLADKLELQKACFNCQDGVKCQYAHSLEEQMYHPFVYKSQFCNNRPDCVRPFCPFLHEGEYYTNELGGLQTRKYDSLQAWNNVWKNHKSNKSRTCSLDGSMEDMGVESTAWSNQREPATRGNFRLNANAKSFGPVTRFDSSMENDAHNLPWTADSAAAVTQFGDHQFANSNSDVGDSCENAPVLNMNTPFPLDDVETTMVFRFAKELFSNCRRRLNILELSVFRTTRCPHKNFCPNHKAPTRCWATHASNESNRWLRRNPYVFSYKHLLCPVVRGEKNHRDYGDGKAKWLACSKGRNCGLAHSIEEQMYHPFVYKTTPCCNQKCERPFCPFLHPGEQTKLPKDQRPQEVWTRTHQRIANSSFGCNNNESVNGISHDNAEERTDNGAEDVAADPDRTKLIGTKDHRGSNGCNTLESRGKSRSKRFYNKNNASRV